MGRPGYPAEFRRRVPGALVTSAVGRDLLQMLARGTVFSLPVKAVT